MGGGGSGWLSDVRRDSGGEISPKTKFVGGAGQPVEYGSGGGALECIDVGITRAVAVDAIFGAEV